MNDILPHKTEQQRKQLINDQQTLEQLNVKVEKLGRYSNVEILTTCVVCHSLYQKKYRNVLSGAGLTCSSNCRKTLHRINGQIAMANATDQAKQARLEGRQRFLADKQKNKQRVEKRKQTCLQKYGTENPFENQQVKQNHKQAVQQAVQQNNDQIKQKRKQTNLQRYGAESYSQTQQYKQQTIERNQQKYKVNYYTETDQFKQKKQQYFSDRKNKQKAKQNKDQTCLEKYGTVNPSSTRQIKEKIKQTNLEKYQCENFLQDPDHRERLKKAFRDKYKVENPSQLEQVQQQTKQTYFEKYGVYHHLQLADRKNLLRQWCEQNPQKLFTSSGEKQLLEWIRTYYPSAEKIRVENKELDIYIPELKIGIEYNGLYYHNQVALENTHRSGIQYHLEKTNFFKQHGIKVIHIWEHEWKFSQQQVKSFLTSAIGKNTNLIGARKCELIWTSNTHEISEVQQFLQKYHIQKSSNKTKYGCILKFNNEIIGCGTFANHHRVNNSETWVLNRFCTKQDWTIQGGLSRISKYGSKMLNADIISWGDIRLTNGSGYLSAGWQIDQILPPDYFYWTGSITSKCIISKQARQKSIVNTPENMTELEHATKDGLLRVWDCGKIRFIFKRK
jgi:hypothetical protein